MRASLRQFAAQFPGLVSIGRNAAHFVIGEWTEAVLRAVYAVLIAYWLGPDEYGWWSYALAVCGVFITFATLGTELLLPERVGRNRESARPFLDTSIAVRLLLLCFFAGVLAVYALVGTELTMERMALLVLLPTVIARGTSNWLRVMSIGYERAALSVRPMVAVRIAELFIGAGLMLAGANVIVLLALHGLSWILEVCVILPKLQKLSPFAPKLHRAELPDIILRGSVIGSANAMTGLLFAAPLILLRHYSDNIAEVGQFGLALQLAMFAVMAMQSVLTAAQSVLSRAIANDDARAGSFGAMFLGGCLLLAGPIWLLSTWLGVPVVTLILGSQYETAGRLLPACLMLAISVLMASGYWQLLVLQRRIGVGALASAFAVIVLFAVAGRLIQQFGPVGAAYAAIVAGLLRSIILVAAGVAVSRQKPT